MLSSVLSETIVAPAICEILWLMRRIFGEAELPLPGLDAC